MPRSDEFIAAGELTPGQLVDVFVPNWKDDRYERSATYVQERVEGVMQLDGQRVDVFFVGGERREYGKLHQVRLSHGR